MNNYTIHFNRAFEESHTVKADSVEEAKRDFMPRWNLNKEKSQVFGTSLRRKTNE